ncbi:hypothetical protein AKG98_1399 [Moritella sp. JT01]|uniref:hypothetical protein n=1 Tax=Moritella sp. JT01 TaxID=756698 RepID=UPI00079A1EC5|nr:hypothetical protein [Moritella sp. JT01]KXO09183.1 hypothetical protein AKG98_1399 [Moritella sp. JT01]
MKLMRGYRGDARDPDTLKSHGGLAGFIALKLYFALIFLSISGFTNTSNKEVENHHIGSWDLVADYVADYCDETYELRDEGTQTVIRHPEISVGKYTFKKFGDTDFYVWAYTVIEYNNKPNCNGTFDTHLGEKILAYVKFKNNYTEMHIYSWPNEEAHIGGYLIKR